MKQETVSPAIPAPSAEQLARELPADLVHRHLGLPRGAEMDGMTVALATGAREWYARHGKPWSHVSRRDLRSVAGDDVRLDGGAVLKSPTLARGFESAAVHAVAIAGVSAGPEVDAEIDLRWREGRPDEAMFLSAYAVAIAEHLRASVGRSLAAACAAQGMTVLPHYSPGYEGWGLADQAVLFAALADRGPIEVLPSGALRPAKSTLAAFGITRRDLGEKLSGFWCRQNGAPRAAYAFPETALAKWSRERLRFSSLSADRLRSTFRFDGTTCSSVGLPFRIDYEVELHQNGAGEYLIAACSCAPIAGDLGHRAMCAYQTDPEHFLEVLHSVPPLIGRSLEEAVAWEADVSPAGCLCLEGNRNHKWRIVFQTVHYALARNRAERGNERDATP